MGTHDNIGTAISSSYGAAPITISVTIEIELPDALGPQVQAMRDRLPEILERGMRDLLAEQTAKQRSRRQ